ncbi:MULTISPECIES: phage neck terminator protein [unclassified Aurantimonas]|uniref:phage neck terminator protein n=1 Tax=unclassified Aurantimonas TaxID=2638230 RepID=UPI002E178971|nr:MULTISPECIES: hypothetical protein [unclassified Aurantimonas]MEC5289386.1 hypothetical protein [Aurantimonas sp. C2-3-R2]MEC5410466.1 hypothetical protein [Aurantimonas sp. C2-4-R8]
MTEAEVLDATRNWIASITGVLWINSYQGGPEPAEPYGVINLMMSDALYENPIEDEYPVTDPGLATETIRQAPVRDWYWRFSLNVYGNGGATALRQIKTAQKVWTAMESLHPLTLFETSQIRDAAEILNEEWQSRKQIDIEIRGIVRDGIVIDVAETAAVVTTPV